jgi:hypothetical protein
MQRLPSRDPAAPPAARAAPAPAGPYGSVALSLCNHRASASHQICEEIRRRDA